MSTYYSQWDIESNDWILRLKSNAEIPSNQYILKNSGDTLVAEQLICYPKAELKFPTLHKLGMVYTKLSLEQSSGEFAANYKADLVKGDVIWDLTGGLGMDSAAFSQKAATVHHNEPDESLSRIARHNHNLLGIASIQYHNALAEQLIHDIDFADTIYIDPSRRSEKGRTFLLADCVPDVIQLLPLMKQKSKRIIVKLSPIYDLKRVITELPGTRQLHVVSVKGEVKEILAILDESLEESITSVVLPVNYTLTKEAEFDAHPNQSESKIPSGSFLHVADPAIYKANTLSEFSMRHNLKYWGAGGYLFSDTPVVSGCQSYRVLESMLFKPKELKKQLKDTKVNIHKRNFPIEVSALYKTLSTTMGDDYHLLFTTLEDGSKAVCIAEPPSKS